MRYVIRVYWLSHKPANLYHKAFHATSLLTLQKGHQGLSLGSTISNQSQFR